MHPLATWTLLLWIMLNCGSAFASTPIVEPLRLGLQGAGCSYSITGDLPAIFVVDSRSRPGNRYSVARINVEGAERVLDWIGPQDARSATYARGAYTVTVSNEVADPQRCSSIECEGTYSTATLTVTTPSANAVFEVRARCGA